MIATLVRRLASFYTRAWSRQQSGIRTREYESYDDYVRHQSSKLEMKPHRAEHYDNELQDGLEARIGDIDLARARVLCLAARLGGEVRAFRSRGAFAWGVDLNPGPKNTEVAFGDFHQLSIPDDACDIIFTNSLDHAQDLVLLLREAHRVLKRSGTLILELPDFTAEPPGAWESTYWESIDDVVRLVQTVGFSLLGRKSFASPWSGTHVRFEAVVEV